MWLYSVAILGYLVALTAFAVWQSRRTAGAALGADDFFVAGRALPAHVLLFTLLATWVGSGSVFGGAGLGYQIGLAALWQLAGAWLGIALLVVLAPRVRALAQYTVPDILETRYGPPARLVATLTIVLAYTSIAAYQFRGGGRLLNLVAGIDPDVGALVTAGFCVFLTGLGGMRTIARLDVVNGVVMLVGAGVAIVYLLGAAGGRTGAVSSLRPEQLTVFGPLSPRQALTLFLPALCVLLGEANMYQKLFSARDPRTARLGVMGWLVATIVAECLIAGIGLLGSVALPGLAGTESGAIVIRVAVGVLPTLLGMLLLAAAAAIVISTANSMLLTPATTLVRDVYLRFINPAAGQHVVLVLRVAIVALAALGVAAGRFFPTGLAMTLWAYTMYVAGVTPALVAALVWPRVTRDAGLYSMAAGLAVTLVWEVVGMTRGAVAAPAYLFGMHTIFPALLASVSTLVGVTVRR
jgi:SSS family solute:Na+ symporter/sodium/proline symporter